MLALAANSLGDKQPSGRLRLLANDIESDRSESVAARAAADSRNKDMFPLLLGDK